MLADLSFDEEECVWMISSSPANKACSVAFYNLGNMVWMCLLKFECWKLNAQWKSTGGRQGPMGDIYIMKVQELWMD